MAEREKILEVRDLNISFRTDSGIVNAIRGVNLDLYKGETIAEYHTTVTEATNAEGIVSFNIGTFPTTGTENASIILKLYADGKSDSPVYQNTLNNVRILRNQLTRISTDFNYTILGNSGFSVTINPDWDGTNNDDETIIP